MQVFSTPLKAKVMEKLTMNAITVAMSHGGLMMESEMAKDDHVWLTFLFENETGMNCCLHDMQIDNIGHTVKTLDGTKCKILI